MNYRLLIALLLIIALSSCGSSSSSLKPDHLLCENLEQPLGIDNVRPHFSWQNMSNKQKACQTAYEIEVASDSLLLVTGKADLWQSGRVESADQVMVEYDGQPLSERSLCYWRVRTWDELQRPSVWSKVERFSVGLLNGMAGDYIGMDTAYGDVRSPLLRSTFNVQRPSATTFVHVNSLGYHELYVNGHRVGDRVLQPAMSQLDTHSLIVTYDVTPYIIKGVNELVVWAGQGWYKENTFKAQYPGPLVKVEVDELLADRQWCIIWQTDVSWQASPSSYGDTGTWYPLQFGGERIDGRLLPADKGTSDKGASDKGASDKGASPLASANLEARAWTPVKVVNVDGMRATPQMFGGNRIVDRVKPKSISETAPGEWLIDMGRVLTGWLEVRLSGLSEGQEVTTQYTDYIPVGSTFESQGEGDVYVVGGSGHEEVFCNKFNHHAFRYVLLKSPIQPEVTALQLSGVSDARSSFACSDDDLNRIHDMIHYTMQCLTFSGYMVDCPHLERMGYGGDGNSSTMTLQTMYDVAPTFLNWLTAWGDVVEPNGSLPYVAPAGGGGGGPYWSGFIVMAPWRTYLNYADPRPMERLFDKMNQWLGYVEACSVDGLLQTWPDTPRRMWFLGDWLAPQGVDVGGESPVLASNCFVSDCLLAMTKMARALGRDTTDYVARRQALNQRIHEAFYHPESQTYGTGSVLDMCYPVLVGAVPDSLCTAVNAKIVERSRTVYGSHIAAGLMGVPIFTQWATEKGEVDLMVQLLRQPDYPGYLHMLANGATTTWESWNAERSRVHNCYNGIGTWFYQALAGLRPDAEHPGYRHVTIAPQQGLAETLSWVKASVPTPYGPISVEWRGKELQVDLPVGVTADVVWGTNQTVVTAGHWKFKKD